MAGARRREAARAVAARVANGRARPDADATSLRLTERPIGPIARPAARRRQIAVQTGGPRAGGRPARRARYLPPPLCPGTARRALTHSRSVGLEIYGLRAL